MNLIPITKLQKTPCKYSQLNKEQIHQISEQIHQISEHFLSKYSIRPNILTKFLKNLDEFILEYYNQVISSPQYNEIIYSIIYTIVQLNNLKTSNNNNYQLHQYYKEQLLKLGLIEKEESFKDVFSDAKYLDDQKLQALEHWHQQLKQFLIYIIY